MKTFKSMVAIALATTSLMGCVSWKGLRLADHPKYDMTLLEVRKTTSYLVFGKQAHQFYSCIDKTDQLDCTLLCDGDRDLLCPTFTSSGGYGSSNVR